MKTQVFIRLQIHVISIIGKSLLTIMANKSNYNTMMITTTMPNNSINQKLFSGICRILNLCQAPELVH